jgi:hypothetical protein
MEWGKEKGAWIGVGVMGLGRGRKAEAGREEDKIQ